MASRIVAAILLFWLMIGSAPAAPITHTFEFSSTEGPLVFGPTLGSFTYDDSIVPAGGGHVALSDGLIDLVMAFAGLSFDETTANTAGMTFAADGTLELVLFGTHCSVIAGTGSCGVPGAVEAWSIHLTPTFGLFSYGGFNGAMSVHTTEGVRFVTQPVAEPPAAGLAFAALIALAAAWRRKVRAPRAESGIKREPMPAC